MRPCRLIVFVKAPRLGAVKTRLAQTLGPGPTLAAYRRLVATVLAALAEVPEVELRFTPDAAAAEIEPWRRAGWHARPQGGGDLGERLDRAVVEAFRTSRVPAVIIGSDCPWVTRADLEAAAGALADHDVVLGPATDGGYWLIGLRAPQPALFRGIPWSTDTVLRETLARARDAGLRVHCLRTLTDVDAEREWNEFLATRDCISLTPSPTMTAENNVP